MSASYRGVALTAFVALVVFQIVLCAVYIWLRFGRPFHAYRCNKEKQKEPFAQEGSEQESIFVPKICFGGFCIEGDDVKNFVDLLKSKYDDWDMRLRTMENLLDETLGNEKGVRDIMRNVDQIRVDSLSAIEEEMQKISQSRRKTIDEFRAKIEEMERERKKSADLIDSLVQKRISSSPSS